ncbi:MAG: zinc ribbon domain-containing protein [Asgard group archaeon]|nr:zinc ribbon domain-containing protein [Asgard group archaeon]
MSEEEFEYDYQLDAPSAARIDEIPNVKIIVAKSVISDLEAENIFNKEKTDVFKGFFRRPKDEEIKIKNIVKSYEPYLVLGGQYELRYLTERTYDIDLIDDAVSVFILGEEIIVPEVEETETEVEIKAKKKSGFFDNLRSKFDKKETKSVAEIQLTGIEHIHITKEITEASNYKGLSINPDSLQEAEFSEVNEQFLETEASMIPKDYLKIDKFTTDKIEEYSQKPENVQRVLFEKVTITDKKIILYPVYWAEMIYKDDKEKSIRLDAISRKIEAPKGTRYPPAPFKSTEEEETEENSTNKCPECHHPIEADDKFCENCGVRLTS